MYSIEQLRGRRVLVTGSGGFIGGHLVRFLVSAGAEVTTASRAEGAHHGTNGVRADLTDPLQCERVIAVSRPEIIFHLAASRNRSRDLKDLRDAFESNFFATANLFTAASGAAGLQTIVVCGSAEEYGGTVSPAPEWCREAPVSVYSLSKVCSTHLAQLMNRVHGAPCVILRPSLVYGPGQATDMFLPALIRTIAANQVFRMTPGQQTRDFLYVTDIVDALSRAPILRGGEVVNIASGAPLTLGEVATKVARLMGREHLLEIGALAYRPADVMEQLLDNTLAKNLLGWAPQVALDEGLARTVAASLEASGSE